MTEPTITHITGEQMTLVSAPAPAPKPGAKTTEFYFSGSTSAGLLALVTQVTDWRVQIACALGAALVAGMYSLSRSRVKAAATEVLS
jgi:hypothetical protein